MRMHKLTLMGLALFAAMLIGGAAQAAPVTITINATITHDDTGFAPVGDPLNIDIFLDDATPNEDVAPNYLATGNPGTLSSFLIVAVTGTIFDVTGTGDTSWDATGEIDLTSLLAGIYLPISIEIDGVGMTPGQITPDFVGAVTGQIVVDLTPLAGLGISGTTEAAINSVTIVPEPSTALLLGLGLMGLGATRRRNA
jgi:hypothetical protein